MNHIEFLCYAVIFYGQFVKQISTFNTSTARIRNIMKHCTSSANVPERCQSNKLNISLFGHAVNVNTLYLIQKRHTTSPYTVLHHYVFRVNKQVFHESNCQHVPVLIQCR